MSLFLLSMGFFLLLLLSMTLFFFLNIVLVVVVFLFVVPIVVFVVVVVFVVSIISTAKETYPHLTFPRPNPVYLGSSHSNHIFFPRPNPVHLGSSHSNLFSFPHPNPVHLGSSHSNHLALHCLALFRCSKDAILLHWFFPYFMTAALRISSSVFLHTPPFIIIRPMVAFRVYFVQ